GHGDDLLAGNLPELHSAGNDSPESSYPMVYSQRGGDSCEWSLLCHRAEWHREPFLPLEEPLGKSLQRKRRALTSEDWARSETKRYPIVFSSQRSHFCRLHFELEEENDRET